MRHQPNQHNYMVLNFLIFTQYGTYTHTWIPNNLPLKCETFNTGTCLSWPQRQTFGFDTTIESFKGGSPGSYNTNET